MVDLTVWYLYILKLIETKFLAKYENDYADFSFFLYHVIPWMNEWMNDWSLEILKHDDFTRK